MTADILCVCEFLLFFFFKFQADEWRSRLNSAVLTLKEEKKKERTRF